MGITGLLPLLKSIHKNCSLKKFAGQTIGVDAYGWLHRGTVACAIDLALDKPTTKYVEFAMNRVRMLIYFGVTPYLVFDGDNLPSKAGTEIERAKRRKESKLRGLELYRAGKISQAHQELQKAIDVTPLMARQLIEELKRMDIPYVVAPFEADAQLVYLEKIGIINGILSEDSDLLVFGAKRLLTKLDQHGDCVEINREDFASCRDISLAGWTDAEFRRMAILSGCDYLASINKMGLKTAYRYIRKYKTAEKTLRMLQFEGQFSVPTEYLHQFQQAELTFLHQRVFCPIGKRIVFLNDLSPGTTEADLPFLGVEVDCDTAVGIACGDLDPTTKKPLIIRHLSSSARSASAAPRKQNLVSASDLKPNKSLDSFFKPKREPLAELDPNSLTPSPSQQRLLELHANASWEVRSVSSGPQSRRTISSMSEARGSLRTSIRSSERADFLARAAAIPNYQVPKRQRLCSESENQSAKETLNKSPFFSSVVDEPSPSVRKIRMTKKSRKPDFDIFSDDSVEAILLELPQTDVPAEHMRLNIQPDEGHPEIEAVSKEICDDDEEDDTEVVLETCSEKSLDEYGMRPEHQDSSKPSKHSTRLDSIQSTAHSNPTSADENPGAFKDLLESHVRKQNHAFQKTFFGQTSSQQSKALKNLQRRPESGGKSGAHAALQTFHAQSLQQQARALAGLTQANTSDGASRTSMDTPSLDTTCQGHSNPCVEEVPGISLTEKAAPLKSQVHPARKSASLKGDLPTTTKLDSNIITTEGRTRRLSASETTGLKGSEDLIVPNSEDESDQLEELEENESITRRILNLGKYVFTPK